MTTPLKATKVERTGRVFLVECQHPHLTLPTTYQVELPAFLVKQLAGLLIQEEGVNEQKSQSAVVTVTGVVQ
jgi:hypothetical protein